MTKVIFTIFLFVGISCHCQIDLTNSTWITTHKTTFKFFDKSVQASHLDYLSEYEINGDTLHFIHDFSVVESVTVGKKKIPRRDFELPDSYFIMSQSNPDSLILTAINPTAIHLVNELKGSFGYYLTDKEAIKWEKSGNPPQNLPKQLDRTLTFWNINTIKKDRQIHSIDMSTVSYGWTGIHYFDIKFDSSLNYSCRRIVQDYNSKEKIETFYFNGRFDQYQFDKIERLFGLSDLPDSGSTKFNRVMATHDSNFSLTVKHNLGISSMAGNRASLPDYVRDFFDSIHRYFPLEEDETEIEQTDFPESMFVKN
ncbi:hypothetical protein K6119_11240 [Paracrocinitomix mangrovi]|uniref:hypothetical protein n=1 Tax=Paracrocinitomix mangrovi TaxID=2862509 RepID=UPI001C8DA49E|nr:hypothetical protein [Paracrocinitomix mangrovi]UKN00308.1 hypothetical protein K6119_11240 [Paracrocinitomix mangrovi]